MEKMRENEKSLKCESVMDKVFVVLVCVGMFVLLPLNFGLIYGWGGALLTLFVVAMTVLASSWVYRMIQDRGEDEV